ncbi:MAG: hypothetical protein AAF386_13755 [Pseudomonadota bacterium]
MQTPPQIFDPKSLAQRHARIRPDGLFLHHLAQEEISIRQADVNRPFTQMAIVTHTPQVWTYATADMVTPQSELSFPNTGYDLIVHAMGLHQSNDPLGQMIQCRNHLAPDGLFLAVFLGGETLATLRQVLTQAEQSVRGGVAPRIHPMIDVRDAGGLMQRAGFALPVADILTQTASYRSVFHMMADLRTLT